MDEIDDCFVKFFLGQAIEIEPPTIQSLIDHGYKTKISLLALDLVHDLPLITDVPMAQRSILRKYVGTLQEFSPFILSIDENALQKYNEPPKHFKYTNKKRKFEDVESDSSGSESDYYKAGGSGKSSSSVVSPRGGKAPKVSNVTNNRSPSRQAFNGVVLPPNMSPLVPRRLSIKFEAAKTESNNGDIVMQEEYEQKDSESEIEEPKPTKGRSRVSKKKEVTRTPSQIRYEKIKQLIASPVSSNEKEEEDDDEEEEEELQALPTVRASGRRSAAPTARARTSVAPAKSRASVAPVRASIAPKVEVKPVVKATEITHVPTPAELAIRAKIEAKKLAKDTTKPKRGRAKK